MFSPVRPNRNSPNRQSTTPRQIDNSEDESIFNNIKTPRFHRLSRSPFVKMPTEAGHRRECQPHYIPLFVTRLQVQEAVRDDFVPPVYVKGRHLSYQRGKRITTPGTSLIKIEGVENTEGANFYLGKKVAFVYRAQREVRGSKIRVIWGKITRPHGNSGVVRAQFRRNLPPKSFGASVRVMLYPSSI
ncbi:hypothetical protein VE00_03008 [Pseudogymnoascus sp. WSF 3629]|nr:hypothetical protein VE00_03008 [Pseudogymnoascus sp. WSF 3629]